MWVAFGIFNILSTLGQVSKAYNEGYKTTAGLYVALAIGYAAMFYFAVQWLKDDNWVSRRQLLFSLKLALMMVIINTFICSVVIISFDSKEYIKIMEKRSGEKMTVF